MADGIGFNYIPGSGLTSPLASFEVNSGGQYFSVNRLILEGHAIAGWPSALPALTPTPIASQDQADLLCGPRSQLREMFRIARQNAPAQEIWVVALPEVGIKPVWSLTVGTLPGIGIGTIEINGEEIDVPITAADTPATIAYYLATAINAYYEPLTKAMLPVTATASGAVVTVTGCHAGGLFNETDFFVPLGGTNLFATTGVLTVAQPTSGSGNPVVSGGLNALGDDPADFVVSPWTDTASMTAYGNWASDVSGRWAWSRQSYGVVWTSLSATFAGQTTFGLAGNDRHITNIGRITGGVGGNPHPGYLWAAGFAARLAPWLSDCNTGNVSRNQTGLPVQGLRPPRDRTVWPNYPARNTLNNSGVSTWQVGADGSVQVNKMVTMYKVGASGQPDSVFRDVQKMYQVAGGLKKMRADYSADHGNKALAETNPGSLAAISTPSDIKATLIHSYDGLCKSGVFSNLDGYAQRLVVKIDTENPDRVNVYNPMEAVAPLDILAANATIYQRFPDAA